jgi:hypothetical protein
LHQTRFFRRLRAGLNRRFFPLRHSFVTAESECFDCISRRVVYKAEGVDGVRALFRFERRLDTQLADVGRWERGRPARIPFAISSVMESCIRYLRLS